MFKVKALKSTAVAVILAATIVSVPLLVQADAVRPVSDNNLSWLDTGYPTTNPKYGWNTTNNPLTNIPDLEDLSVAATGGQTPMACMVGGADYITVDSQADWDTTQGGETLLTTAFSLPHSNSTTAWTGTGHGKFKTTINPGTGNEAGWDIMSGQGVNVLLDKPEQHSSDWIPNTEIDSYYTPNDVTVAPAGPMATPAGIESAVHILAQIFGDPNGHESAFDTDYESYMSDVASKVATYTGTKKKVLYVHGVNTTAGTVRLMSTPPSSGSDDYNGYIMSYYIKNTLNCDNIIDDYMSANSVPQGEDGNIYVSYAQMNSIINTYHPDYVIFCYQSNESTFRNTALSGTAQTWYNTNIHNANNYSGCPCGMYNVALRSPDTALAPAFLCRAIYGSSIANNYTYPDLRSQAESFYSDVYGFTASDTQIDGMYYTYTTVAP